MVGTPVAVWCLGPVQQESCRLGRQGLEAPGRGPLHEPAPGPGVGPVGVRGPGPADGPPGVLGQGLEFGPDLGYQPPLLSSAVGARATSSSISRSGYISDKFPFNPKVLSENGSNIKATVVRLTPEDAHNILSLRNFQRHRRIVQGAAP